MGFFDYLDAHPVWVLVYLIVIGFFGILAVGIRRDHTATAILKIMTDIFNKQPGISVNGSFGVNAEAPKGPRPLNG